jgi:hypothetical protein
MILLAAARRNCSDNQQLRRFSTGSHVAPKRFVPSAYSRASCAVTITRLVETGRIFCLQDEAKLKFVSVLT